MSLHLALGVASGGALKRPRRSGSLSVLRLLGRPEPLDDAGAEAGLLRDEDVPAARAAAAPEGEAAGGAHVVVVERLRPQPAPPPARRRLRRLIQRRLEAAEAPDSQKEFAVAVGNFR